MGFVNLGFLFGAALMAVPVILHLIMRRKPKHVIFPALRFLVQRQETNQRRLQLKHLLLLAARMAIIGLLALALARPTFVGPAGLGSREAPVTAVLLFDTSTRMDYQHENRSRLDWSRELGAWLLGQLPADSKVAILDSQMIEPVFQVDLASARDRLERLRTTTVGLSLSAGLKGAETLFREETERRKELYLFTDLTQVSWPAEAVEEFRQRREAMPDVGMQVIDVGVESPKNLSVGEIRLSNETLSSASPWRLAADVSSIGLSGQRMVEVYLLDEKGREEKKGEETIQLEARQTTSVEFHFGALQPGSHQGYIRIIGADGLEADDVRYFTVEVRPSWPVLLVASEPADEYSLFFHEAVAPYAWRKNQQARFACDVLDWSGLSGAELDKYAAVCLLDPPPLENIYWQRLQTYVEQGGGLGIFLGENAIPPEDFQNSAAADLLPGPLANQSRYPEGVRLSTDGSQHAVLRNFRPLDGTGVWNGLPVYRYWELQSLSPGVGIVAEYDNGRPALLERAVGQGRVLTLTTPVSQLPEEPAERRWNMLPSGFEPWPFVMLSNEMLLYLVGGTSARWNYLTGETAVLPLDEQEQRANYLLTIPGGESLRVSADAKQNSLIISHTEKQGNYRALAGGEEERWERGFSVNLSSETGNLRRIEPKKLDDFFGPDGYKLARDQTQITRDVQAYRVGSELFVWIMAVVALILGLEHWLANRFYQQAPT